MNRRKAIFRISLAGVGVAAAIGGYEWHGLTKKPDLDYLTRNKALLAALAETIIPSGDTPGAREAQVQDFIIVMVRDCADRKTQNKFIDGLKDLQGWCRDKYDASYQDCGQEQKLSVLRHFEEKGRPFKGLAGKVETRYFGKSFFTLLKEYTVEGYCTSEPGATKGLAYLYIPGRYQGCITLEPGQRAWATN